MSAKPKNEWTRIAELEAELKRMRLVFNSALRWYRLYTTDLDDDGKPTWDTDRALFINCARAERAKAAK